MAPSRRAIAEHTNAVLAALDATPELDRESLAGGALGYLRAHSGFDVDIIEHRGDTYETGCDVAGSYEYVDNRPRLIVASASTGRMNFTVLHELAHHLQQHNGDLVVRLLGFGAESVVAEEAACESFAARVLIPDPPIERHFRAGVTASAVVDLWRELSAVSRSAVCVAAADHLPAPGHVLLVDPDGLVVIDAARGVPPVRRESDQSGCEPIARALRIRGDRRCVTAQGRLRYRDGITGDSLFMQTHDMGGYTVVIAVTDRAPWSAVSVPDPDRGPRTPLRTCEYCFADFSSWDSPCKRCHQKRCTECGRCRCESPERRCVSCFLLQPAAAFGKGAEVCSDCC